MSQQALEKEVNAAIRKLLFIVEELAVADSRDSAYPATYNEKRTQVIRVVWNLVKRGVEYGASTVQPK